MRGIICDHNAPSLLITIQRIDQTTQRLEIIRPEQRATR